MHVIELARAGPGFLSCLSAFKNKKNLESSHFMFSSDVAVKLHHAGVVWNKTVNK